MVGFTLTRVKLLVDIYQNFIFGIPNNFY